MDNLGSYKGKTVRRLIRSVGAKRFFLPRYAPDPNPIEQVFAKLKALLRKTDPRTIAATWHGIGDLLDRFTPAECANYLANAGYASTSQDHALSLLFEGSPRNMSSLRTSDVGLQPTDLVRGRPPAAGVPGEAISCRLRSPDRDCFVVPLQRRWGLTRNKVVRDCRQI